MFYSKYQNDGDKYLAPKNKATVALFKISLSISNTLYLFTFSAVVQEEPPNWGKMEALNLVNNIQDPILVNAQQDLSSNQDDLPLRYWILFL